MIRDGAAIVTGGESGIGAAIVEAIAKSGRPVTFTYLADAAAADAVAARTLGRAVPVRTDVGDEQAVERLFEIAEARFGPVVQLVNSAGLNMTGVPIADMPAAQFDRLIAADLRGPFLTCRRFVRGPGGDGAGRIVNISSIHERAPRAGGVDYCAAKGGLAQLTATLALELAPRRIAVNGIAPGMILTPMNRTALNDAGERARREAAIPWGRAGRADEVAALALFLLSDAADYITGTTVTIDGGLSLVVGPGA